MRKEEETLLSKSTASYTVTKTKTYGHIYSQ